MVLECCAVRQRKWSNLQQGPTWQAGRLALCRPRVNKPACALFTKGQQPSAVRTAPVSPRPPAFTGHCRILRRSNRFRCLTPNNEAKFHGFPRIFSSAQTCRDADVEWPGIGGEGRERLKRRMGMLFLLSIVILI